MLRKLKRYRQLNQIAKKGQIVFSGSSLCEQFPILELIQSQNLNLTVYNRGIGGFVIDDLWEHRDVCIFDLKPRKLFLNIGSNDIGEGIDTHGLLRKYGHLLEEILTRIPEAQIYVLAYYPANTTHTFRQYGVYRESVQNRTKERIREMNEALRLLAEKKGACFLDVNRGLTDEHGQLKPEYCVDGIHMWPDAYEIVLKNMLPYLLKEC